MDKSNTPGNDDLKEHFLILKQSQDIQALLIGRILSGGDLDDLSRTLADVLMCCVFVEDVSATVSSIGIWEYMPNEHQQLFHSYMTENASACVKNDSVGLHFPGQSLTVNDEYADYKFFRIVFNIQNGNERLGTLSILRIEKALTDGETDIVQNAVGLFAVLLQQGKKMAEVELRLKGNFIEDLISAHYSDSQSILNRARALEYNISIPHRVLVAEIENMKQITSHLNQVPKTLAKFKFEMVESIQNLLDQSAESMVGYHKDEILILVQLETDSDPISRHKKLCEQIIRHVSEQFNAKMYIGIGSICSEFSDFSKSYRSAKKSLEIGAYMITEGQIRSFEQFSVHALFMSTLKPAELYDYARSHLGDLLDYDETHHTGLLKTLQEFLYLRNNVEKTARSINMSVSGLKYRLKKIEKIIGLELMDYKVSFDLQLALIILQLFGEYSIKNADSDL